MGLFSLPPRRALTSAEETRQAIMVALPDGRQVAARPGHPVSPFGAARHIAPYSSRSMLSQSYLSQVIIDALTGTKREDQPEQLNEFTALNLALVWRCVRAKGDALRTIPFRVVKRVRFDEYEQVDKHPMDYLLNVSPDGEMDAGSFKAALVQHVELWGNYFVNAGFAAKGRINSLRMMLPLETTLRRQDGQLLYDWSDGVNTARGMTVWQVVHGRNVTFDGIVGLPPITLQREVLGVPHAATRFAGKFLRNMARPSVLVSMKGRFSTKEQYEDYAKSIMAPVSGDKTGGIAAVPDEADVKTLTMPLEDAQFIETWEGTGYDVCRIFSVPPWKAYIKGGANYSSASQAAEDWRVDSLAPLLSTFEQTFGPKCLERGLELQALDEDLLRGDLLSMTQAYGMMRQWGLLTPNEIRRKMGLQGIDGGDTMFVPANQLTIDKAIAQDQGEAASAPGIEGSQNAANQLRKRLETVEEMTAVARDLLEPHVRALAGIEADRLAKVRGTADEVRAIAAFWQEYEQRATDRLAPVVRAIAKVCMVAGLGVVPESQLADVTRHAVGRLIASGQRVEKAAVHGGRDEQQGMTAMRTAAVAGVILGTVLT